MLILNCLKCLSLSLNPTEKDHDNIADSVRQKANKGKLALSLLLPFLQRFGAVDEAFPSVTWPAVVSTILVFAKILLLSVSRVFRVMSPCALTMSHSDNVVVAFAIVPALLLMVAATRTLANGLRKIVGTGKIASSQHVRAELTSYTLLLVEMACAWRRSA